jgi:hypothetical protein
VTPYVVSLNRFVPNAPALPSGGGGASPPAGVDSRTLNGGQDSNYIVDVNWNANPERDIVGYAVFRTTSGSASLKSGTNGVDQIVCDTRSVSITTCSDPSPPASGGVNYYVVAFDQPWKTLTNGPLNCTGVSGQVDQSAVSAAVLAFDPNFNGGQASRPGCPSNLIPVDITAGLANQPPTAPSSGAGSIGGTGLPHLTWTASTAQQPGASILYYRIYRDPAGTNPVPYNPRYDTAAVSATPSYDDPQPGASTTHKYFVTAVDSNLQESQPLEIDTP